MAIAQSGRRQCRYELVPHLLVCGEPQGIVQRVPIKEFLPYNVTKH